MKLIIILVIVLFVNGTKNPPWKDRNKRQKTEGSAHSSGGADYQEKQKPIDEDAFTTFTKSMVDAFNALGSAGSKSSSSSYVNNVQGLMACLEHDSPKNECAIIRDFRYF